MPRKNKRMEPPEAPSALATSGAERRETFRNVEYVVRSIAGTAATKRYRCPGCDQELMPGQPHVVAWPADDPDAGDRRHWHTACWAHRNRRAPGVQRSRSAPRY